jgi:NAD(P)-dependent dehydrogenase (short-subunit alcohol dehydrogenase family)
MRWVITGGNRGIGLEFVRQTIARGDTVDVGVRRPEAGDALAALAREAGARLRVIQCDVADDESVRRFAAEVGEVAIDVLVNNAGIGGRMTSLEQLDLADVMRVFDVDALGPIRVTRALLGPLERAATPRVVSISSGMGSIADNTSGGAYAYRMAKAALNMANRSMSVDLRGRGIVCVVMNPGWVQTDMGGRNAPTPVAESIGKMLESIDGLTLERTGEFLDWKGGTWPY